MNSASRISGASALLLGCLCALLAGSSCKGTQRTAAGKSGAAADESLVFETRQVGAPFDTNLRANLLIPYRRGNRWGFSDTLGRIMVEPVYDSVTLFEQPSWNRSSIQALIFDAGRKGVIVGDPVVLLPPVYDSLTRYIPRRPLGNGSVEDVWNVVHVAHSESGYALIRGNGEEILQGLDTLALIGDGDYAVLLRQKPGERLRLYDLDAKPLTSALYTSVAKPDYHNRWVDNQYFGEVLRISDTLEHLVSRYGVYAHVPGSDVIELVAKSAPDAEGTADQVVVQAPPPPPAPPPTPPAYVAPPPANILTDVDAAKPNAPDVSLPAPPPPPYRSDARLSPEERKARTIEIERKEAYRDSLNRAAELTYAAYEQAVVQYQRDSTARMLQLMDSLRIDSLGEGLTRRYIQSRYTPALQVAFRDGRQMIYDREEKKVIDPELDSVIDIQQFKASLYGEGIIEQYGYDMIVVGKRNGYAGIASGSGEVLVPFEYNAINRVKNQSMFYTHGAEGTGVFIPLTTYDPIPARYRTLTPLQQLRVSSNWSFLIFEAITADNRRGYIGENGVEYFEN